MEIKQWQIMKAKDNGATIERILIGGNNWEIIDNPGWNWIYFDYRIANRSADGILFQDFINELKDDCSNLLCPGAQSIYDCAHIEKDEFVEDMINFGCEDLGMYTLKKEPKYRPCENIVEASRFIGKYICLKYNSDCNIFTIQGVNDRGFFILPYHGTAYEYHSYSVVFENYTLTGKQPIGIKEEN